MYFITDKYQAPIKKTAGRSLLLMLFVYSAITAAGQNINKPNKTGPMGTQVNTYSGNLFISRNDIYIPARGFNISVTFNYNSFNQEQNTGFGNGWSFGYSIKYINDTANSKTIVWGEGREDNYAALPGGGYRSPRGFFNTLTQYQPGRYLLTELNGTKFYFDNSTHKRITKVEERNGNYISFNYTDTLLNSIVSAAGQTISFTYNSNGRLATVVDAVAAPARTYTYTYESNGNLKQVTDPLGGTIKYSYLVNGPMKTMTDKNNNTIDIIYFNDLSVSEIIGCNKRVSFSYDTATHTTIVTDHLTTGNNQVTKYGYKKTGAQTWLSSISGNCCGFNMSFEFDADGNKIKETDANGNAYTYTYDTRGNMVTLKDPLNQTSTYTYSAAYNRITSVTDPKGNVYSMLYDANGNLTQLIEPGNNIYAATYSSNGDIITSTDPKGNTYTYSFDVYGNPLSVSGPGGYHAVISKDARGNLLSFTDARGNSHTAEFDILNRLKKITDPLNNAIHLSYDAEGNITSVVNKNNETSVLNYDASNRLVKFTSPVGQQVQVSYDGMNNITTAKSALGSTVHFTYNSLNRLIAAKDPHGNTNGYGYDANGNITSVDLPGGQRLTYTYDNINRLTAIGDVNGVIESYTYDRNNNITGYTNGTGTTISASYDSRNRLTKLTDALGFSTQLSYDQSNNVVSITDRNGATVNYTYDSLNRVKTYTDENGFVISVAYDAVGNVIQAKDQNNNITTYAYDSLNRVKTSTYPDGKFVQYGYDKKNNITSRRLTDGTTINFQYDSLNRMVLKTLPDGQVFTYGYDVLNRVVSAATANGTVGITYDALNRVTSETYEGRITRYQYNIAGRTQTTIYPDSTVVTKNYDTRNRLTSIAKNNTTLVAYQYNNANQVTVKSFANGVVSNIQYDFANRLSSISTAGGSIQHTLFTYDNERNKTSVNRLNNPALSEQFTYDNGKRLIDYRRGIIGGTPAIQNTYSYDAVGNRTNASLNGTVTTYASNNLNQLTGSNNGSQNINFIYDNNGNLTYDGIFYKTYDAEGRLLKDSSSPANVLTYQYDAFNRRVYKNMNGVPFRYSYSGLSQIEERDGITNNITGKTIFTGFLTPVWNEKNNNSYYYHQNELNSVEAISNSSGNLTERYQYDVYGKPVIYDASNNIIAASIAGNRFGFTGQEYDSSTGSYRFHFRNYSPSTGTFNQRDLIGYGDGMGMYQYVGNDPANGIDVLGLQTLDGDPCSHDPNKVRYITSQEIERAKRDVKQNQLDKFQKKGWTDIGTDFQGIGSADSRFYDGLSKNQFGRNQYYFQNQVMQNYEVNYFFTGYVSGIRGYNSTFAQISGRAWLGLKGVYDKNGNEGWRINKASAADLASAFNPFDTRANLMQLGNIEGRLESSANLSGPTLARDVLTGGTALDGANLFINDKFTGDPHANNPFGDKLDNKVTEFGEWWPVINPETGEMGYEFFANRNIPDDRLKEFWDYIKNNCPQNGDHGGTQKPNPNGNGPGTVKPVIAVGPKDPNAIIGPDGKPDKHWVSIKDRLAYTVLYENDSTASAPAKFVRITSPIEPKQDAATFQLGNFGFNNQTFSVPPGLASYYQRLDCRDSLGLYVDITAGYDQINHVAFWEFQSIDPITLLPPTDPLKGFLLLQDSAQPFYGHGFVNFSIKPVQTAVTLDTIGARAAIVFDLNDTIATNIHSNTIDAFAPTSHMNALPANSSNPIHLSWTGTDDTGGCGIDYYTVYVSTDQVNFSVLIPKISSTDTIISLPPDSNYCFFVLATDRVGNKETLRPGEIKCSYVGPPLPVTWLYFRGKTVAKDNILDWATANEQNAKRFDVERSLNGTSFSKIGDVNAHGNSNQANTYQYTDYNIHRLGSEVMFYRLKQIDIDGNYKYSNIVRLRYSEKNTVNSIIYPNPTQGLATILVGDNSLVGSQAMLYDMNGRLLESIKIPANSLPVNLTKYVNGVYFIKLSNNEVLKIVKQ